MADLDIWAALERAANAGDPRIVSPSSPSISSIAREKQTANTIRRFLESCPEDCTVLDLLENMEELP